MIDFLRYEKYLIETPEGFALRADAPKWVADEIWEVNEAYRKEYGGNLIETIEAEP